MSSRRNGSGEFAFGCVTGQIFGAGDGNNVAFSWQGNDEMDEAQGNGWAEIQPDGSINGQICFHRGDEVEQGFAEDDIRRPC